MVCVRGMGMFRGAARRQNRLRHQRCWLPVTCRSTKHTTERSEAIGAGWRVECRRWCQRLVCYSFQQSHANKVLAFFSLFRLTFLLCVTCRTSSHEGTWISTMVAAVLNKSLLRECFYFGVSVVSSLCMLASFFVLRPVHISNNVEATFDL